MVLSLGVGISGLMLRKVKTFLKQVVYVIVTVQFAHTQSDIFENTI
jgi:hypothetical protein